MWDKETGCGKNSNEKKVGNRGAKEKLALFSVFKEVYEERRSSQQLHRIGLTIVRSL